MPPADLSGREEWLQKKSLFQQCVPIPGLAKVMLHHATAPNCCLSCFNFERFSSRAELLFKGCLHILHGLHGPCIHTQLHRCANPVGPNCLSTSGTSSRTKISLETRESRHFSCMRDNALSTLGETCHCLPISKTKRALHSMIIGPPTPNQAGSHTNSEPVQSLFRALTLLRRLLQW